MKIDCAQCGKPLNRPPSRIKANPNQFCDHACHTAYQRRNRVEVACAICDKPMIVVPSRAARTVSPVCSPACERERSRRARIAYWDSAERRVTTCAHCGQAFTRKPSQLAKYAMNFCGRTCHGEHKRGKDGPNPRNGEMVPCQACGTPTYRTPATRRSLVFCSQDCRRLRAEKACEYCGTTFRMVPSQVAKRAHCSRECQRAVMSLRWMGEKNPLWHDGSSLLPYAPGFTPALKRRIRKRDGNLCQICGAHAEETRLDVHHIDRDKANHAPNNLVTLCSSCHLGVHHGKIALSS